MGTDFDPSQEQNSHPLSAQLEENGLIIGQVISNSTSSYVYEIKKEQDDGFNYAMKIHKNPEYFSFDQNNLKNLQDQLQNLSLDPDIELDFDRNIIDLTPVINNIIKTNPEKLREQILDIITISDDDDDLNIVNTPLKESIMSLYAKHLLLDRPDLNDRIPDLSKIVLIKQDGNFHPVQIYKKLPEGIETLKQSGILLNNKPALVKLNTQKHIVEEIGKISEILSILNRDGEIIHMDVNVNNLLVDPEEKVHLNDFGISSFNGKMINDGQKVGLSLLHCAPEQIGNISTEEINGKVDTFGIGTVLAWLFGDHNSKSKQLKRNIENTNQPNVVISKLRDLIEESKKDSSTTELVDNFEQQILIAFPNLNLGQSKHIESIINSMLKYDPNSRTENAKEEIGKIVEILKTTISNSNQTFLT